VTTMQTRQSKCFR